MATATIVQNFGIVPYTPSGAKSAGDIVVTVSRVGIVVRDIAANVVGEMSVDALAWFPKTTGVIADGTRVFWNNSGPYISTTSTDGVFIGTTVGASLSGDTTQLVRLIPPGPAAAAQATVVAAVTENSTTLGGTNDGNIPTLAMSVTWNGSSVYPSAADAVLIIAAIRECAAKCNEIVAALKVAGIMASS